MGWDHILESLKNSSVLGVVIDEFVECQEDSIQPDRYRMITALIASIKFLD